MTERERERRSIWSSILCVALLEISLTHTFASRTAGGEKYLCGSIFFKYAVDLFGIYGSDHYAQKAAGLELKHLNTLFALGRVCSFPLMCLVLCLEGH